MNNVIESCVIQSILLDKDGVLRCNELMLILRQRFRATGRPYNDETYLVWEIFCVLVNSKRERNKYYSLSRRNKKIFLSKLKIDKLLFNLILRKSK